MKNEWPLSIFRLKLYSAQLWSKLRLRGQEFLDVPGICTILNVVRRGSTWTAGLKNTEAIKSFGFQEDHIFKQ
jgi:hypothetical protein